MKTFVQIAFLALAALVAGAGLDRRPSSTAEAAREALASGSFEQDGLLVEMRVDAVRPPVSASERGVARTLASGSEATIAFTIRESQPGGAPLSGVFPMGWLVRDNGANRIEDEEQCKRLIRGFLIGRLARAADVNLNRYYLVTLDDNNSVSIIDPQIESSKTKTLGMVSLPAKGEDFVLSADGDSVFVSLGALGKLAAADLSRKQARYVDLGGRPDRLALAPDGRLLWVGDKLGASVHVVDARELVVRKAFEAGEGPHRFSFRSDGRYAYVIGHGSSKLSVIDTHSLVPAARVELGRNAAAVAATAHGGKVYVALRGGNLKAFDDETFRALSTIPIGDGATQLAVSLDGRWLFALNPTSDRLFIVDTTTDRLLYTIRTLREPVRVDVTETFAYVRHGGTERYLLVDLGTLGQKQQPLTSEIVMGRQPPAAEQAVHDRSFVRLPEGGGALLLNPLDRSIYHFMEGMAAPMGNYALYPWPAKGILLADRSLREVKAGVYQTSFRAPKPGTYRVAFLIPANPQLYDCSLSVEISGSSAVGRAAPFVLDAPFTRQKLLAGVPSTLELKLSDDKSGIDDVVLLVFRGPSWQWRGPARHRGEGSYEARVIFPEPGQYTVMLKASSRGKEFRDVPSMRVTVAAKDG